MSDMVDDGGQAFPVASSYGYASGMTLLDWFAGQALAGMLADPQVRMGRRLADKCYEMAENMLNARHDLYQKAEDE